jgi:hypothetical protein
MTEEPRGWRPDTYGGHEQRYFSRDGRPTRLVQDGGKTSYDSPPEFAAPALPTTPGGPDHPTLPIPPGNPTPSDWDPPSSPRARTDGQSVAGNDPILMGSTSPTTPRLAGQPNSAARGGLNSPIGAPNGDSAPAEWRALATNPDVRPRDGRKPYVAAGELHAVGREWQPDPVALTELHFWDGDEPTPSTRTLRRWRWDSRINFVAPWLIFSFFVLWQGTTTPVLTWQDSLNYESIGSLPLWSSGFWFGGRPPLTPFLWKLTGSPGAFLIGQSVISSLSWGFLAWTVGGLFPAGWRRTAAFLVVLAFATTTPIEMWNRSVLSESLALSGLALLFAFAIRFARRPSPRRASALVAAAFWCALARDTEIILPLMLGVLIAIFAVVHRHHVTFKMLIATACALFLAAGFCIATVIESGRDALNTKDNLYVRVFPYPAIVAWFASHGMPEKEQIDQMANATPPPKPGIAKTVFPDLMSPPFARLDTWVNKHGASTYALWVLSHPWDVVLDPLRTPDRTYNDANGNIYYYAAHNKVTSGLTPPLWPPWYWLIGFMAVTIAIINERDSPLDRVTQVVIVLGLIGIPAMLAAWNGDGQEVTRHTIEGLAQIRLGVLISFLYVVLSHPRRRGIPVIDETKKRSLHPRRRPSRGRLSNWTLRRSTA